MAPVEPYIKKDPNDLIRSGDWNDIQVRARQEIRSHTHKGDADGTPIPREGIQLNAIDGSRIDPGARVTVAQLKVNDRDLLADINALLSRANTFDSRLNALDGRANALDAAKVNRSGDTLQGTLTIASGALVPSAGNSSNAGIQFPPGRGTGDAAFIRYYSLTADRTRLMIGITNGADDTMSFYQMGGERLTLRNGIVEVNSRLGVGTAQVDLPAKLSLGTELAATKIALHDNPTDLYGLGIGSGQFRLHVGNANARFSFLNAAAGTEVVTIRGNGSVGINEVTPDATLHVKSTVNPLRLESSENRVLQQFVRKGTLLWDFGVGTGDANNADFWFGDMQTYRLVIQRGTGRVGINDTTPSELLSIAGVGSCIELGSNVADKEANGAKIAFRKWRDALEIVGAGTNKQRRVYVHAEHGTTFNGNIGTRNYDPNTGMPPGWTGGVHTFDVAAHGTVRAKKGCQSQGWDLAEKFDKHDPTLEPGDVVVADPSTPERLIRSSAPYERTLLGVISEKPGFLLGVVWEDTTNPVALGLSGRVPVKVTLEGGPIRIGDPLTSSSTPGHAMRATRSGRVIGTALDHFDGRQAETGKIVVFLNPHWLEAR